MMQNWFWAVFFIYSGFIVKTGLEQVLFRLWNTVNALTFFHMIKPNTVNQKEFIMKFDKSALIIWSYKDVTVPIFHYNRQVCIVKCYAK